MKKHLWLSVAMMAVLAGCSTTKLEETPVEDRAAAAPAPAPAPAPAQATPVEPPAAPAVDETKGPANVSRLVYFDYDSYVIKPEFQPVIDAQAQFLKAHKTRKVVIEGHTDERGGSEYNLALGQRRAEAVRKALTLLGVADGQTESVSFGKEKPAAQGNNEAAWSKNRRAEFSYR